MEDRVLEAEQSLLAAILLRNEVFRNTRVVEDDFADPRNRKIFRAMGELAVDGIPLTGDMLHQRLNNRELFKYMTLLTEHGISAYWQHYDQKVREYSCKRKLADLAGHLGQWAKNGDRLGEIIEKLDEQIRDLKQKIADGHKSLHQRVQEWVLSGKGVFNVTDCYRELHMVTERHKATARKSLERICAKGLIKPHGRKRGVYRLVETDFEPIEHEQADDTPLDITLPFGLHKHIEWFPKGIGVIAGDTDSGKTAIMLNLAYLNQGKFPRTVYIATEMGPALLKRRLIKFCSANDCFYPDAVKGISFRAPKTVHYMDLIDPDGFNIIDYYELSGDQFTEVAGYFRQIYDRLNRGVAFIALQKKFGAALGRSAELAMEKPLLYLTLHRGGIARIEKCKTEWTQSFQPYAIQFQYKIVGGGKLTWGKQLRPQKAGPGGG
jgi:hypothetical protein